MTQATSGTSFPILPVSDAAATSVATAQEIRAAAELGMYANAEHDATYLLAKVEVVATYKLAGINRTRMESLFHRLFAAARLDITIDIQATKPDGFDESEVRTIGENARVLKFDPSSGFEKS